MVKHITDPANDNYDFGQEFNYAVWSAGTIATLTNVPWNNDYKDVVKFPLSNGKTLDQWIDDGEAANIEIPNMSYLKFGVPVKINIPHNRVLKYNYLRVQNPLQPIPGSDELRSYYYFILDSVNRAPNVTELTIQLDIFQSFNGYYSLGNCFIERGHIGIANTKQFDNYGRDYLTVPEGLDYGGEYRTIARVTETIMGSNLTDDGPWANMNILLITTNALNGGGIGVDYGTTENPNLKVAYPSLFENLPSGAGFYLFKDSLSFVAFMNTMQDAPWVANGIISITGIPEVSRYIPGISFDGSGIATNFGSTPMVPIVHSMFNNWRSDPTITGKVANGRFGRLKKFFTFPYMVIEGTTWTGTPITLKPESWNDANATVVERATLTPPNQRVELYPRRYNAETNSDIDNYAHMGDSNPVVTGDSRYRNIGDDGGDYLDVASKITNFPTFAIVNNGALNYLASNFASIAYQGKSAEWTQDRAMRGNQTSYDQANRGINTSSAINNAQVGQMGAANNIRNLQTAQSAAAAGVGSAVMGSASSALSGNLGGVVSGVGNDIMGAVQAGITVDNNNLMTAMNQSTSKAINNTQNSQTGYVADTNKQLSDWAAKGDYENTIAGINAMVRGASMVQPTSVGQMGGEAMNLVHNNVEFSLRIKLIDNASLNAIGNIWLRFGYAVNRFGRIPASLMVMEKFTYWKVQELYITSAHMPEGFKQIIRGIFEKGVTVWADPSYIGQIDWADNAPLAGVTL